MRNIIQKIEQAEKTSKNLADQISILVDTVSQYGNETDKTVKAWLASQESRIDQLEKRKETVKRITQGLIKIGYKEGFEVSRFTLRAKDVLGDSYEKANVIKHNAVSLDKTSETGNSLGDNLESGENHEKGRKVKLSFDELKNLLQTSLSPAIWAKCFNINDFLFFSKLGTDSKNVNESRRFAIKMIIAETHNRTNELNILKAQFEALKYKKTLKEKYRAKA